MIDRNAGDWQLRWNFNKPSYKPRENAWVTFWLDNSSDRHRFVSEVKLKFGFGTYSIDSVGGQVPPRSSKCVGTAAFQIPANIGGAKSFRVSCHLYEFYNSIWHDRRVFTTDAKYFLGVYPEPRYRMFISRGLSVEDRAIGDPIAGIARGWGFDPVTIGIEVRAPDDEVTEAVKREIQASDAIMAIATPRFADALTGLWKTLEWLHAEVGIAFGIDRPLLILKDRRVSLAGLPLFLVKEQEVPLIEFEYLDLDKIEDDLSAVMPKFREGVRSKTAVRSFNNLLKGGMVVLAAYGAAKLIDGSSGTFSGHD